MPNAEEVLVPAEEAGSGVGADLRVHPGLLHPGGGRLRTEADARRVLLRRLLLVLLVFYRD